MDSDKLTSVAVDLQRFATVDDKAEGSESLVELTWEKQGNTTEHTSHFILSQIDERGASSVISPQHVRQLLNNNLTVFEFALKMYEECSLKLQTINYPPLNLVFQHDSESNLKLKRQRIFYLLSSFLQTSSKLKTNITYKINIKSEKDEACDLLSTGRTYKKKKKHQLMTDVQRRIQDADRRLDRQQQQTDCQLSHQENRLDTMLEELSEMSKTILKNDHSLPEAERVKRVDMTPEPSQNSNAEVTSDNVVDHTSLSNKNRNEVKNFEKHRKDRKDTLIMKATSNVQKLQDVHDDQGNCAPLNFEVPPPLKKIEQREVEEDTTSSVFSGEGPTVDKKQPVSESFPGHSHTGPQSYLSHDKAIEVNGCQANVWDDEMFPEGISDDEFDDLYDDDASYLDSSYVSAPGKFRRRAANQRCGIYGLKLKSGSKVYNLAVLATYTNPPATTATKPKSVTYPSGFEVPVTQTYPLNFQEEPSPKEEWGAYKRKKEMTWNTAEGQENLRSWLLELIGDSPNWTRLSSSVEEALVEDTSRVARTEEGMDTILCLDTSGSMAGPHLEKMKKIILEFIDGIEATAKTYNIHENIALVTFGGRARVIQHLTNDYTKLRQSVQALTASGPGPMHEAIVVSLACLKHSGLFYIDSKFKLPPRLVIMCDGFPTSEQPETDIDNGYITMHNVTYILNALRELNYRQLSCAMPHPIAVVPIGYQPNMHCLESVAAACGGSVVGVDFFSDLYKFQHYNMIAAEALMYLRNNGAKETVEKFEALEFLSNVAPGISPAEAKPVYDIIEENFIALAYSDKESIHSFCNIHEEPDLPPLGSRVVRGQDWKWNNQDTEGTGTIINHAPNKLLYVQWDNAVINVYRYGHSGKYDVAVVEDQPRESYDQYPHIGCQVERGPQWRGIYGDQDGGQGSYGVIIRKDVKGRFLVRWTNGNIFDYRCYTYYTYDVILRDPLAVMLEATALAACTGPHENEEVTPETEDGNYEWQREDRERGWETYSQEDIAKLNKAFAQNHRGTCLVLRNGSSYRVSFRKLEERSMDNTKVKVRRLPCKR